MWQRLFFLLELLTSGLYILAYQLKDKDLSIFPKYNQLLSSSINIFIIIIPIVIWVSMISKFIESRNFTTFLRKNMFSVLIAIPVLFAWYDHKLMFWIAVSHLGYSILSLYDPIIIKHSPTPTWGGTRSRNNPYLSIINRLKIRPAQTLLLSFFLTSLIGAIILTLPFVTTNGVSIPFVDAVFVATSSVCVTGLSTIDVGTTFNTFGQIVILLLIQLGGLGIMTLSTSMLLMLGRTIGIRGQLAMQDILDVSSLEELKDLSIDIVKYTFFIEFWGAIALSTTFFLEGNRNIANAIFCGIFHSISIFCNAGISIFSSSFESFATSPAVNIIVITLTLLGGLGFIVLKDIKDVILRQKKLGKLFLHTKVVLTTSLILLVVSTAIIFFNEYLESLADYSIFGKLQIALFQAQSSRTSGLSSINLSNFRPSTLYFITMLMLIGTSPASTGGGLKTTTLAILFKSLMATLFGKSEVTIYKRKISQALTLKAMAISFIYVATSFIFVFLLLIAEKDKSFLAVFFEVFSATGTVGLSLGITEFLTVTGKFLIVTLMFLGRVGPLTLFIAFTRHDKVEGKITYPEGRILIG